MKPAYRLLVVALAVAGLPTVLPAQTTAETPEATNGEARESKSYMRSRLTELLKAEAGLVSTAPVEKPVGPVPAPGEMLVLEPLVVTGKVDLPPPVHETRIQEFFRTGTIWEKVGPKFTRRFWVDGGKGIGFTLSW